MEEKFKLGTDIIYKYDPYCKSYRIVSINDDNTYDIETYGGFKVIKVKHSDLKIK